MAGIYLHIPFCKQACHYCDFHFSVNRSQQQAMVNAISEELALQRAYLAGQTVDTIYFGGGTPSLLTLAQLHQLLAAVRQHFEIGDHPEVTLEANPDDLSPAVLKALHEAGINRLSIGIQSFHEAHLRFMNRAHNATEAATCVQHAQTAGFDNISIDLIYGIPLRGKDGQHQYDHSILGQDIAMALRLGIQHISAYCLTIEPATVFGRRQERGQLPIIEDAFAAEQFERLLAGLEGAGYEQYEISNYSLPGYRSRHNSNYWLGAHYLGVGPSAHSFNGLSRQHNAASNGRYLKSISQGQVPFEREQLTVQDQINDYLLTALRTVWGVDMARLKSEWQYELRQAQSQALAQHLRAGHIEIVGDQLLLTPAGRLLADGITADLMV